MTIHAFSVIMRIRIWLMEIRIQIKMIWIELNFNDNYENVGEYDKNMDENGNELQW